jgi:hypothetical protein
MLNESKAYSGIGVTDLEAARRFYGETLEQEIEVLDERNGLLTMRLKGEDGDRPTLIYVSPTATAASYTVLNFPVADVGATVEWLGERGVEFERYEGMEQDEKGVSRGRGPEIAWFKDPSGNVLAVHELP